MVGDNGSHQEEGIFKAQQAAAARRLNQPDGLREQHSWGISYLGRRVLAIFCIFYYVVMFAFLASYSFFGSTSVVVMCIVFPFIVLAILQFISWRRVQRVREEHFDSYN